MGEERRVPSRIATLRAHQAAGGKVAAVFPVRAPRGLLRGFGYLPVEVWGPPRADVTRAAAHLQSYVCSIARCGLAWLQQGGLDIADLLVVPHACDALQGLGSELLDFFPERAREQPVWPLYLPRGDDAAARAYLAVELHAIEAFGEPGDLLAAVRREEEADEALGALFAARARIPLSNLDFYALARTREYLPAEQFTDEVRAVLAHPGDPPEHGGVPVVLSGIVPEPMAVLDALSDAGALVVADDLAALGRRVLPAGTSLDPFERSAERLLGGPPCSTRSAPVEARVAFLRDLVSRAGARAVVFLVPRSCEPEQFYRPLLQRALREDGVHEISVEVDIDQPLPQQVTMRLEALVEAS